MTSHGFLKPFRQDCRDFAGLDNYATHKHAKVMEWIEWQKRIFLHFTPTSALWLNLVEQFFCTLTRKRIRRGVFHSVSDLDQCLKEYIETYNEKPEALGLDEVGGQDSREGEPSSGGLGRRLHIINYMNRMEH